MGESVGEAEARQIKLSETGRIISILGTSRLSSEKSTADSCLSCQLEALQSHDLRRRTHSGEVAMTPVCYTILDSIQSRHLPIILCLICCLCQKYGEGAVDADTVCLKTGRCAYSGVEYGICLRTTMSFLLKG